MDPLLLELPGRLTATARTDRGEAYDVATSHPPAARERPAQVVRIHIEDGELRRLKSQQDQR